MLMEIPCTHLRIPRRTTPPAEQSMLPTPIDDHGKACNCFSLNYS